MTGPKVEFDLDQAKTILRACRYAEPIPALSVAYAALVGAVEEAERNALFDNLSRGFAEGFERGAVRARRMFGPAGESVTAPRPRWDYVARATGEISAIVKSDPAYVAHADALGAYVRDTFDALGLSLHDEGTLYVSVVMASLMVEMANNGRKRGVVEPETVAAVAKIAQSYTASILDFLPPEARA